MKFRLEIDMDNDEFENRIHIGVGRIILDVANRLLSLDDPLSDDLEAKKIIKLRDVNGNTVGKVWLGE